MCLARPPPHAPPTQNRWPGSPGSLLQLTGPPLATSIACTSSSDLSSGCSPYVSQGHPRLLAQTTLQCSEIPLFFLFQPLLCLSLREAPPCSNWKPRSGALSFLSLIWQQQVLLQKFLESIPFSSAPLPLSMPSPPSPFLTHHDMTWVALFLVSLLRFFLPWNVISTSVDTVLFFFFLM